MQKVSAAEAIRLSEEIMYRARNLRVAGETRNQEMRRWQHLDPGVGAETIHSFPNGYSIRRVKNDEAARHVGEMMRNCWQDTEPEDMRDGPRGSMLSYGWQWTTLHDEHGIPRTAFYVTPHGVVTEVLGMRNFAPHPQYAEPLAQWAGEQGYRFHDRAVGNDELRQPDEWLDGAREFYEDQYHAPQANPELHESSLRRSSQEVGQFIANLVATDDTVYRAYQALSKAGGKVFAVGGCVRDALLGKEPHDIDLMVTGIPPEVVNDTLKRLPGRVDLTGKDFGVYRYREGKGEVEIALPRRDREGAALDANGRPDASSVQADHTMTPQEDLYRRDFTPNAMAVELDSGKLIDPFGGADDIRDGRFRTLSETSLRDDPLRAVRALVLRGKHGLEPDDGTRRQLGLAADGISHLPSERVQAELDKLFSSKDPAAAIRLAHETGLLKHIFPEVDRAFGYDQNNPHHEQELGEHLLSVLRHTASMSDDPDLRLAALLHDIGKPASRWSECRDCTEREGNRAVRPVADDLCHACAGPLTGHYYEHRVENTDGSTTIHGAAHEAVGADMARQRLGAINGYRSERIARVGDLVAHHMYAPFTSEKGARKFLNRVGDHADDLLILRRADQGGKSAYHTDPTGNFNVDRERDLIAAVRAKGEATSQASLAVNGHDIIQHLGIQPGPQVGQILRGLTDDILEDPSLNERETLLQRAQMHV